MNEKGLLHNVKNVIHSLVVSSPDRMTVERLKRDYASEEGMPVPFAKLGYRNIESFLNSIGDTVLLQGYGPLATVCAQRNAKTAHIQNLVQGQKKPSNKSRGRGGPQGHRYGNYGNRSDIVFLNDRLSNGSYGQQYNRTNNYSQYSRRQYQNPEPEESLMKPFSNINIGFVGCDSSSDENYGNEIYVPEGQLVETQIQSNNKANDEHNNQYQSSDAGRGDKDAIPTLVMKKEILNNNHSKDENHNQIKPEEIEPVVHYVSSSEGSDSDAIPAYAVDAHLMTLEYPKDAVRFDQQLPPRIIYNKFKLEDRIEVQLVTVSSPHNFNFWLHDDEYEDYKDMSSRMQHFYNDVQELKYTIPLYYIMPGHLGAVSVRNRVWRVQVLNTKTGNRKNIEVELMDTGERLWICHTELKYLNKTFATLPPQYWPGRLACVRPRHGSFFSVDASNYFFDLVCYRRLFAKIDQINEADNMLYMVLVDPDATLTTKNINVALIQSGFVRRSYTP